MIQPHHFKPYQEIIVEFINRSMRSSFSSEFIYHQLTTISNHTITVPDVSSHILILLLMMLSSSPASPHSSLYQVPKGDFLITFIPISRLQIPHQTTVFFLVCFCVVVWVLFQCLVFHHLVIAPIHNTNSRGQKCWDLSSDIRQLKQR